ncbi:alpha/beta fold hydrolase BchO [Sulfitobacter guttiformis]|uniref:Magnesium chelatase accessory protein n=1 Tax=Sulfitobacter guttiformis TaxID=74349 RepID=J7G0M2_9RHOB|nr:alpha/beta fold hydrolase BchO [Sulfitobacter guttiformis]AFP55512.1 Mg-protoporphyrin IX chelatase BchO; 30 kDa subunit [Sulfitobacter guttiformis]KIN75471.1 Mg-protoporphyrin IX chelatase BchO 30 kDa subunit [Sulfitobacter guttiformis KCTC 32187]RKE92135.1 magnesium chelatase accessory protein [Sulfitobacter guttiformis]
MDWERHKKDWPHAGTSRFILSKPHKWHVQEVGAGPMLLLLHGAGGATQSFRHLIPLLSKAYRVVAVDLPGQGFTRLGAQARCGLEYMAEDIAKLCMSQGWQPQAIIGHSAGAAVAFDLAPRLPAPTPRIIGINAALSHFKGVAGLMFPLMAKALAVMPGVAAIFTASNSNPRSIQRLIDGTGSTLPPEDLRYYGALVSDRDHVNATLQMMAQWDLRPLLKRLPQSGLKGLLIAGAADRAVPAETSRNLSEKIAGLEYAELLGLGHLAHEEAPEEVAALILGYLAKNAPD